MLYMHEYGDCTHNFCISDIGLLLYYVIIQTPSTCIHSCMHLTAADMFDLYTCTGITGLIS